MASVNFNKGKAFEIVDLAVAFLAMVLGIFWMLGALGFRFSGEITGPLTSGVLGFIVGLVFLVYGLRYFHVLR